MFELATRPLKPLAVVLDGLHPADRLALRHAGRTARREAALRCGGLTQTYSECFFSNRADYTAVASTNAEATLLAGINVQPFLRAGVLAENFALAKAFTIEASGVFSTTGTPTIIFQARISPTAGSATLSGASVGVSAAITTINNSAAARWRLRLDLTCNTPGIGSGNATLSGSGSVSSPVGFASPFTYDLEPTTPPTATWTGTIDGSVANYFNLSVTWGASSSSNTITCKQLRAFAWN